MIVGEINACHKMIEQAARPESSRVSCMKFYPLLVDLTCIHEEVGSTRIATLNQRIVQAEIKTCCGKIDSRLAKIVSRREFIIHSLLRFQVRADDPRGRKQLRN